MKQAMKKWLEHHQITFDPDAAKTICDKFGLDGEKADECLGLCYQLEKGNIDNGEFTGGLCVLTGKEPDEVMGVLGGVKPEAVPKVTPVISGATVNKELLALEFIRDSPTKLLKRKNLYGEFGEDFIDGLRIKGYIIHTLAPDTFLITIKGRAYIEEIMGVLKGMKANVVPVTPATKIEDIGRWAENMDMFISQVKFGTGIWRDSSVYGGIQNLIKLLKPGDIVFIKKVTLETTLFYSVEIVNGKIEVTDRSYPTEELYDPKKD